MPFLIDELIGRVHGCVVHAPVEKKPIQRIASLGSAAEGDVAFFISRAFEMELQQASPSLLVTTKAFLPRVQASPVWQKACIVTVEDAYGALAELSQVFEEQVEFSAVPLSQSIMMGKNVQIGAYVVIEDDVVLGDDIHIGPHCFIGRGSRIGTGSILFPGVTIYPKSLIGERVRLHAHVVIGSDGFGYAPSIDGHRKIYHLGCVVIGDDVEIGANSCVDRGTFGETRIDKGVKIDNLVHVGHNAHVAEGALLCGGVALAGHASIGKFAMIGGLTGVGNHVHVGDGAKVGAVSMVTKDVPAGGAVVGNPQREYGEHFRVHALLSRMLTERKVPWRAK